MPLLFLLALSCASPTQAPLKYFSDDPASDSASEPDTGAPAGDSAASDTADPSPTDTGAGCDVCPASTASSARSLDPDLLTQDVSRTFENPLRGFMTSYLWGAPVTDFPDQMEFLYLPMNELWGPGGETLEAGLEPYLVAAEARGHHAVLRVFVDYPSRLSGLPEYLAGSVSCQAYDDFGGGCSPDYDHPELVAAMLGLIEALGERYDGDVRLGFVQVGLLGFWGEWHTWPHSDWFPSEDTQRAVLDAYSEAFTTTQLQIRRAAVHSVDLRMGFHDDSFAYSTLGDVDWFFLPGLEAAGADERWQSVAIGGELRPELQGSVFADDYAIDTYSQDVVECIEATHTSYLLNYHAFNGDETGYLGTDRERAEDAALAMGYRFELAAATLQLTGLQDGLVDAAVEVEVAQRGVAPFYYPLFLTLQLDGLEDVYVSDDDLHTLLPEEQRVVSFELGRIPVESLQSPLVLELRSDILQSSQQIAFATSTPWTTPDGATSLLWEVQCASDSGAVPLGAVHSRMDSGCDCVCDVDGELRTCGGTPCGPAAVD